MGDSGTTGEKTLNTGNHTVGETAGRHRPDDYSSIICKADNGTGATVASAPARQRAADRDCHQRLRHRLHDHQHPQTGKLEVQKKINPTTDGGLFDLQIDSGQARRW